MKAVWIVLGVAVIAAAAYFVAKKKPMQAKMKNAKFLGKVNVEKTEDEFKFADVVNYFKQLSLAQGKQIPFIAKESAFRAHLQGINANDYIGYKGVFFGVYDIEKDGILHGRVVYAKSLDAKTQEVLANDDLVVLK